MGETLRALCKPLSGDVKKLVQRNAETMMRGLKFRQDIQDKTLMRAFGRGWRFESIETLIDIVSFYQIVIGPIKSATINSSSSSMQPKFCPDIQYGSSLHFNAEMASELRELASAFEATTNNLGINFWWLQTTDIGDLIYKISKEEEESENSPPQLG